MKIKIEIKPKDKDKNNDADIREAQKWRERIVFWIGATLFSIAAILKYPIGTVLPKSAVTLNDLLVVVPYYICALYGMVKLLSIGIGWLKILYRKFRKCDK